MVEELKVKKSVVVMGIIGIAMATTSLIVLVYLGALMDACCPPLTPEELAQIWNSNHIFYVLAVFLEVFGIAFLIFPMHYAISPKKFEEPRCAKCGTKNTGDSKHCKKCGEEIKTA
jgi:ribosomal protein L40E